MTLAVEPRQNTAVDTSGRRGARLHWLLLPLILIGSAAAMIGAMRTTSPTFDETVFIAVGARGFATGNFDLAPDHPPLMQYVYGFPVAIAGAALPDETGVASEVQQQFGYRYGYASAFFWGSGNDPEKLAFLGRLPAVFLALALIVATFLFTRRHWGSHTALLAGGLVAFLPDVLGHGGVAYSDVPVTLALFCGAWAVDEAVRRPGWRRGVIAGIAVGLAFGIKISAGALVPVAIALIVVESAARYRRPSPGRSPAPAGTWIRAVAITAAAAAISAYLVVVLIYRGDFLLEQFRFGLDYRFRHMTGGHGAAAYLLGQHSVTGWWYFFPVAFLFKTSAGLHALLAVALIAFVTRMRTEPGRLLSSGARVALLVIIIFGAALLNSSLNIGFRYAMPVLPWICVLAAVGTAIAWRNATQFTRAAIFAFVFWALAFPLSYYPNFLSFISEYGPGRDRNYTVLVDSSLDWGQGLLALRDYMRDQDIPSVYLGYFGSAAPSGYGIRYVAMPSFFPLPPGPPLSDPPQWLAVSATNLAGVYLPADPYAPFRNVEPDAVLANTVFLYRLQQGPAQ